MLFLFLFMHFQAMIPGLEVVTHHTLVITHRFPTSLRNAKTFQLLLTSICELCTVSKKCLYNENKSNPSFGPLNCHHTEFIQVTTTSWPSTWSPFHNLARTALVQMGSMNFFLWTRSWIEFRGMFFWIKKKNFRAVCLHLMVMSASKRMLRGSQRGKPPPDISPAQAGCWQRVGSSGQLSHCLLWYSSSKQDPEGSKNVIFSYYEHQSASCGHTFLFQTD